MHRGDTEHTVPKCIHVEAMLDKQEIKEGQEIKGLGAVKIVTDPDTKGKVITFDKILDITAESAGKLGF